jgi:VWFA-related protein
MALRVRAGFATFVRAVGVAAFGAFGLLAGAAAQEPPRFPAAAEIVRIDAVVVDGTGRPVTGLTAADFAIEENGKPREIATFEPIVVQSVVAPDDGPAPAPAASSTPRALEPQEGRALLIYFDDIHVSAPNAEWVRHNLGPFLQREIRPGDAVTIVAPHGNFWWTARTPWEHAQLPAVVERLKGQGTQNPFKDEKSDWLVMRQVEYGPKIQEGRAVGSPQGVYEGAFSLQAEAQYGMALLRIRRTLKGLERAIASLEGFRGRKSVVIYSEGFILPPHDPFYFPEFQRTLDQCRRANVALFVADPGGLRTGGLTAEAPTGTGGGTVDLAGGLLDAERAGSAHIAFATGGRVFFQNDATEAVAHVLEESKAYYLIGFRPEEGRPGERKVSVRVRREGLQVRARNRYYWGDPLPRNTDDSAAVVALRAMSDRTDVPFRVAIAPGPAIGEGPAPTLVQLQLDPVAERRERRLKLLIEARPLARGEPVHDVANLTVPASDAPQAVERELRLSPGVWQARVVLADDETGATGSVLHTFEVKGASASGTGD